MQCVGDGLNRNDPVAVHIWSAGVGRRFQGVQRDAGVAIGDIHQMVSRIFCQGCVHRPQPHGLVGQGTVYYRLHLVGIEALQSKYSTPRQQRGDDFK